MTSIDNEMLWRQFGAAIDMFGDALRDCPDELGVSPRSGIWATIRSSGWIST
jgi:hypothetical protein